VKQRYYGVTGYKKAYTTVKWIRKKLTVKKRRKNTVVVVVVSQTRGHSFTVPNSGKSRNALPSLVSFWFTHATQTARERLPPFNDVYTQKERKAREKVSVTSYYNSPAAAAVVVIGTTRPEKKRREERESNGTTTTTKRGKRG
jgi:hypothetical protein